MKLARKRFEYGSSSVLNSEFQLRRRDKQSERAEGAGVPMHQSFIRRGYALRSKPLPFYIQF